MSGNDPSPEGAFVRELRGHLADLRLRVDLGEITSAAAFRAALEQDGRFRLDDPRVQRACMLAGLTVWPE